MMQICNGATFVKLDKIINPRSGSPALLIQGNLFLIVIKIKSYFLGAAFLPLLEVKEVSYIIELFLFLFVICVKMMEVEWIQNP